jgi:hypothetical protein
VSIDLLCTKLGSAIALEKNSEKEKSKTIKTEQRFFNAIKYSQHYF